MGQERLSKETEQAPEDRLSIRGIARVIKRLLGWGEPSAAVMYRDYDVPPFTSVHGAKADPEAIRAILRHRSSRN